MSNAVLGADEKVRHENWDNIFPADSISYALDLQDEIPLRPSGAALFNPTRVSIAVSTFYPELRGGYYLNWRVIGVLNDSLRQAGLFLADDEYVNVPNAKQPVEHLLGIEMDRSYRLLTENLENAGHLVRWQFSAGGGGTFFSDNHIVDIFTTAALGESVVRQLTQACLRSAIAVSQYKPYR